jgi:TPR repeat protein
LKSMCVGLAGSGTFIGVDPNSVCHRRMIVEGQPDRYRHLEAVAELRAAADQGHAPAQVNLGVLYENGRGVGRENFAEAVR